MLFSPCVCIVKKDQLLYAKDLQPIFPMTLCHYSNKKGARIDLAPFLFNSKLA